MMNSDGKTPDTTETILYFGLFALWIMVLVHLKKSPSEQGAETRFSSSWSRGPAYPEHAIICLNLSQKMLADLSSFLLKCLLIYF